MNKVYIKTVVSDEKGGIIKEVELNEGGAVVIGFSAEDNNITKSFAAGNISLTGLAVAVAKILKSSNVSKSNLKMFTKEVSNTLYYLDKVERQRAIAMESIGESKTEETRPNS